ncbi:MAG: cadherin repeat domain-containing protein, partial [Spartobacteria bacterium]|nr:cadherin repeat domain-containing protein [Spartobacteria bacterium]
DIDTGTGEVTLQSPADFETKNSYSFNVVATDNGAGSLTGSKAVTVSVTDVDETPTITSATYNAATGVLTVTGTYIEANGGGADIDASRFTLTGEGGETYTLTDTPDAERDSVNQFTLNLSPTDQAAVNQILNKSGQTSTGGTAFNLAAADDWCTNVTAGDTSDATNTVTVTNVFAPTITSATYNSVTGELVVTGTSFVRFNGPANDIDISMLSVTGTGGSYTLTSLSDVEITSATSFTVTLAGADKIQVDARLDQTGTQSSGSTTYNLAAAEDWARGTDAPVTIADTAGNGITVTVNTAPVITSNGGGATAAVSVAENTTAVTTVTATDADTGQTITYSLNGGTDAAKFNIVGATGVLTFASAPNFENPTDSDTNNTYAVVVQADDGNGGTDFQTITVTVTDVAESSGGDGTTPAPDPTPILPPQDEWDALPDDDGDGIPEEVEALVPGLGDAPQGDGNGDGVMDTLQPEVSSVPFRETGAISDNPDAPVVFVTLAVTEDQDNKLSSTLRNVQQLDTPENLPGKLSMPLGVISFEATVGTVGGTESFSLYVDDSVLVNGYWKQNATGAWVNLASAAYGGKVLQEGGKIRLDFQITDGGEFDDDGVADGVITDPGALGWGGTFATFDHAYYLQSKLSQLQEIGLTEYTSA